MSIQPNLPPLPQTYAWPPLPILDVAEAAAIMRARMEEAYADLEAQRLRLIMAASLGQQTLTSDWIEQFQTAITDFLAHVTADVTAFIQLHIDPRYRAGVEFASRGTAPWSLAHQSALVSLATDTYRDFLSRAEEAQRISQSFAKVIRDVSAEEVPKIAAGGRTAVDAANRIEERMVVQYGVDHVTYANGTKVPVGVWAQMAARTKSGVAFNAGSLNEWHAEGVGYVEVFDGHACGWTGHDDPDRANGSVRSILDAAAHPLAHPNCLRAFGARPDVTSDEQAANAAPSTTAAQRADQAQVEIARSSSRRQVTIQRRARIAAKRAARRAGARTPDEVATVINLAVQNLQNPG